MNKPIYLDYNATTPIDPEVVEVMLPYFRNHFGNPSSTHSYGKIAHEAIDQARNQVAQLIGAQPEEIIFTGGGTEASNHALQGAVFAKFPARIENGLSGTHIITSTFEHPATLQPCKFLERLGCKITQVPVNLQGLVEPEMVQKEMTSETTVVSIMHANNEVGTLQPISEISQLTRKKNVLLHTDAAQSLGKVAVNVNDLGVDLLTIAGHKLYAPKGIGVLYVRTGVKLNRFMHGAGHELGRRAGTENTPYIVGLGKACEIIQKNLTASGERLKTLRDRLWSRLQSALGERVVLNGHPNKRLPNTLNVSFLGHVGSELLAKIPEIAASTGSACHEGHVSISPVLKAMGIHPDIAKGALRLTVGRFSTEEEMDWAAQLLIERAKLPSCES